MQELILHCSEQQAESLSDALLELGVLSVSVEDADEHTEQEKPLFGEPGMEPEVLAWQRNRVVALLPEDTSPEDIVAQLQEQSDVVIPAAAWSVREVPDSDWVRITQAQFGPIRVGEKVLIVPSWHRDDPDLVVPEQGEEGGIRIELDPGLAFGTGSHPTTHLCLHWLAEAALANQNVLDYGCGSGILAIAAKKLGASNVDAVDIDAQAVSSTIYNAEVNQVAVNAYLPDAFGEGQYDVVVANILSGPLKVMASMLCGRVRPGGYLALSGILDWQAEELIEAYAPWIPMQVWQEREGWICLAGRRPA